MMKYINGNNIMPLLMSGDWSKARECWYALERQMYNYIELGQPVSYEAYNTYYAALHWVAEHTTMFKAMVNRRYNQINGFDISYAMDRIGNAIRLNKSILIRCYIDAQIYGHSLLGVSSDGLRYYEVPYNKYIINKDKTAYTLQKTGNKWLDARDIKPTACILMTDYTETFGGIIGSLLVSIVSANYQKGLWENVNEGIKGVIDVKYATGMLDSMQNSTQLAGLSAEERMEYAAGIVKSVEQQVEGIHDGKAIIHPDNINYEHQTLSDLSMGTTFLNFITKVEQDIQIAIIGQADTATPTEFGSNARAKTFLTISYDIAYSDIINLETICNNNVFALYSNEYNLPLDFTFVLEDTQNISNNLDVLNAMNTFNFTTTSGQKLTAKTEEIYKMVGLTMPEDLRESVIVFAGQTEEISNTDNDFALNNL
jgi:hypothetical protein